MLNDEYIQIYVFPNLLHLIIAIVQSFVKLATGRTRAIKYIYIYLSTNNNYTHVLPEKWTIKFPSYVHLLQSWKKCDNTKQKIRLSDCFLSPGWLGRLSFSPSIQLLESSTEIHSSGWERMGFWTVSVSLVYCWLVFVCWMG
jgi:hypothetical protein